jgi:soluble lytic murein transglycosylase-like protein
MRKPARCLMLALLLGVAGHAAPAWADAASADPLPGRAAASIVPAVLTADERGYYTGLFAAMARRDWALVDAMLAARPAGPLHAVALARYYLAPGSPDAAVEQLVTLLPYARELPWADSLARLAAKRGAQALPELPATGRLIGLAGAPRRVRPRPIDDGTMPAQIAAAITDRIKNDDPLGAYQQLVAVDALLSPPARAEWRQKVAWSFYIGNDDASALAVARTIALTGSGPWVAEGWWTNALAAWRLGQCDEAASAFEASGANSTNPELAAAGYYWASRAWLRCRQPNRVAGTLRAAAQRAETFYGLLAAEALGIERPNPSPAGLTADDWRQVGSLGNVHAAAALVEIGEDDLAGEVLRHQARIGDPRQHAALSRLAGELGLPSTQLWMAYNAPRGGWPDDASRYPSPRWAPAFGWTVDPALVFAHALQESNFRKSAVSPAKARGLMQIMPATMLRHSAGLALDPASVDLDHPEVNLALGQRNLEMLRDSAPTQGLLPKVIAAYNAGLGPMIRWNGEIRDGGDPLLWMESIPYWETRGYVSIVLRNYWMYERRAGSRSASRLALAQGLWPRFPAGTTPAGVRLAQNEPGHGD